MGFDDPADEYAFAAACEAEAQARAQEAAHYESELEREYHEHCEREKANEAFRAKSRAWFRRTALLAALLLTACAFEPACPDPTSVPRSWTHVASTCHERLSRPNLDDCATLSFADTDACEAAGHYACANGVEALVVVDSEAMTGSYVVRAGGCESRWEMGGGDG